MTSIDDIITSLIISYNTSDLKKLPEDLREALYQEAKKRLEQNIYDDSMTVSNCLDMKNIIQPLFSYIPDDDCVY